MRTFDLSNLATPPLVDTDAIAVDLAAEAVAGQKEILYGATIHGQPGGNERFSPRLMLRPILHEGQATLILGLRSARFESGQRFAVAIRRTASGGGAIVLNLDAAQLLEFRKRIGIGKMIKALGDNTGFDYVVIHLITNAIFRFFKNTPLLSTSITTISGVRLKTRENYGSRDRPARSWIPFFFCNRLGRLIS